MADNPLWERQTWDTPTSYARFHPYYLLQDKPRSVDGAYRAYYAAQRGLQPGDDQVLRKRAPGSWQRWARGQDSQGQPISGAKTWVERAEAYEKHLEALDREKWEQRRQTIVEADYQVGQELRALAADIMAQTPQFLKTTRRLVKGSGGQPDREVITVQMDGTFLLRAIKLASELQRVAAGVPGPVQEHRVTGAMVTLTADTLAEARQKARELEEQLLGDGSADSHGGGVDGDSVDE